MTNPKEDLFYKAIRVQSAKERVKKMTTYEQDIKNIDKRSNAKKKRLISWGLVGLVACLSLFIGLNWDQWLGADYHNIYLEQNFSVFVKHRKPRSAETITYDTKWVGYDLFVARKFRSAIPALKKEWKQNQDELSLYYLGIAYCAIGKTKKAQELVGQFSNQMQIDELELLIKETTKN